VHAYVALTEFARRKFVEGGLPAEKISVKPQLYSPIPVCELRPRLCGLRGEDCSQEGSDDHAPCLGAARSHTVEGRGTRSPADGDTKHSSGGRPCATWNF